jgi:hypothetical protein
MKAHIFILACLTTLEFTSARPKKVDSHYFNATLSQSNISNPSITISEAKDYKKLTDSIFATFNHSPSVSLVFALLPLYEQSLLYEGASKLYCLYFQEISAISRAK